MGSIQLVTQQQEEPPALHTRAMDNLQYIRETMERATAFTAISGWGLVAIGITGVATAFIAAHQSFKNWLMIWLADAVVALLIAGWSMDRKARAIDTLRLRPVICTNVPLLNCNTPTARANSRTGLTLQCSLRCRLTTRACAAANAGGLTPAGPRVVATRA